MSRSPLLLSQLASTTFIYIRLSTALKFSHSSIKNQEKEKGRKEGRRRGESRDIMDNFGVAPSEDEHIREGGDTWQEVLGVS
jgi:hypothetical protein